MRATAEGGAETVCACMQGGGTLAYGVGSIYIGSKWFSYDLVWRDKVQRYFFILKKNHYINGSADVNRLVTTV
jgi:hypothetical protein